MVYQQISVNMGGDYDASGLGAMYYELGLNSNIYINT